ncbi:glycosyltransferase [Lyngbya aestuarii]|uniref:glycosyltransferase n=1 Tax=Lyngbya aestuarii TaxID=118322 RepID=UPI00403D7762
MKILHVITALIRGGAENHLVEIVKGQIQLGHFVEVACLKENFYWKRYLEKIGSKVIPLKLKYYGDFHPVFLLRQQIKEFSPDIVHAHLPPAEMYTVLALLGVSKKIPLVISKHNDEPFYQGIGQRWLGSWVAQRSQRIIAISDAVKNNTCLQNLGCSPHKVVTIPYGIDTSPYEKVEHQAIKKLRSTWSISDDTYLIGTVCRLVPQKALHVLLEGFKIYSQQAAKPTKLVIVGTGILEVDLKQQALQLGIQQDVIWAGFREDIPVVMNALDLFTLTSIYEGLGLVLLEAMAAAKPVVSTCVSAIPEVVEDKVTGLLVPPGQPLLLAEGFKFFEESLRQTSLGTKGRQRVKEIFTVQSMIEQTLLEYTNVLNKDK